MGTPGLCAATLARLVRLAPEAAVLREVRRHPRHRVVGREHLASDRHRIARPCALRILHYRQFSLQAVAVATVNATYSWVESEARRVLREVLNVREKERRQEVTPPVACTRRARVEVSDDDDDDDDDANRVGAGAAA